MPGSLLTMLWVDRLPWPYCRTSDRRFADTLHGRGFAILAQASLLCCWCICASFLRGLSFPFYSCWEISCRIHGHAHGRGLGRGATRPLRVMRRRLRLMLALDCVAHVLSNVLSECSGHSLLKQVHIWSIILAEIGGSEMATVNKL